MWLHTAILFFGCVFIFLGFDFLSDTTWFAMLCCVLLRISISLNQYIYIWSSLSSSIFYIIIFYFYFPIWFRFRFRNRIKFYKSERMSSLNELICIYINHFFVTNKATRWKRVFSIESFQIFISWFCSLIRSFDCIRMCNQLGDILVSRTRKKLECK